MAVPTPTEVLFDRVSAEFFGVHDMPHVEVEFRLGRQTPSGFDPDVGPDVWGALRDALGAFPHWESACTSVDTVERFGDGVRAISEAAPGGEPTLQLKRRVAIVDVKGADMAPGMGLDVRFAVAQELPLDASQRPAPGTGAVVERMRWSFTRKGLRIDLTRASSKRGPVQHLVELEVLAPRDVRDPDVLYAMVQKVENVQTAAGTWKGAPRV
jgi:hypothetical protein